MSYREEETTHRLLRQILRTVRKDDVPLYVVLVPAPEWESDFMTWSRCTSGQPNSPSTKFRFHLFVIDESSALLPGSIPKSEAPAHSPVPVLVSASQLRELCPLLFVLTQLLATAHESGQQDICLVPLGVFG